MFTFDSVKKNALVFNVLDFDNDFALGIRKPGSADYKASSLLFCFERRLLTEA